MYKLRLNYFTNLIAKVLHFCDIKYLNQNCLKRKLFEFIHNYEKILLYNYVINITFIL
jgi:hypothetical protein